MIASTHGPIWRNYISEVIGMYDRWSKYETEEGVVVAYASMYGNTEEMAEAVARELAENGIKHIRVHDRITSYNVCYTKLLRLRARRFPRTS